MAPDSSKDSGIARHGDDLVKTVASEEQRRSAGRIRWQAWSGGGSACGGSFACLMIPVVILVLISGSLALATQWSPPESVETVRFWFYFFDVGREINLPTWFSAGLWITAGILAGYFARRASRHRRSWALFCVVCLVFSIDETLELHERLDVIGDRAGQVPSPAAGLHLGHPRRSHCRPDRPRPPADGPRPAPDLPGRTSGCRHHFCGRWRRGRDPVRVLRPGRHPSLAVLPADAG